MPLREARPCIMAEPQRATPELRCGSGLSRWAARSPALICHPHALPGGPKSLFWILAVFQAKFKSCFFLQEAFLVPLWDELTYSSEAPVMWVPAATHMLQTGKPRLSKVKGLAGGPPPARGI